jgi:hypothetical protein
MTARTAPSVSVTVNCWLRGRDATLVIPPGTAGLLSV